MKPHILHHIFCDESRTTGHQYMVLGGIILTDRNLGRASREIQCGEEGPE